MGSNEKVKSNDRDRSQEITYDAVHVYHQFNACMDHQHVARVCFKNKLRCVKNDHVHPFSAAFTIQLLCSDDERALFPCKIKKEKDFIHILVKHSSFKTGRVQAVIVSMRLHFPPPKKKVVLKNHKRVNGC